MADDLILWGVDTFEKNQTQNLDCWAANITKTSTGFRWDPYKVLDSLSYCRRDVKCDQTKHTCNCYVTALPW